MLVAISDVHLTDGSTSTNVKEAAFSLLKSEILSQANKNTIHILLLGDIFDVVRTDYWFREYPDNNKDKDNPKDKRPWGGTRDPETGMNNSPDTENQFLAVLELIFKNDSCKAFIKMLNDLKAEKPETKITYVIGNHDRVFNNFESMKTRVKQALPGYNADNTIEFTNCFKSSDYGLLARHGHVWDEECHGVDFLNKILKPGRKADRFDEDVYKVLTIGEVITAELMGGLIYSIRISNPSPEDDRLLQNLLDVNNVRPMTSVFSWLQWFGKNLSPDDKQRIVTAIKFGLESVLNNRFAKDWDQLVKEIWIFKGDITDRFQQLLNYIGNKSFDQIKGSVEIVNLFADVFSSNKDIYVNGAGQEFRKEDKSVQFVMYGHTHDARHDYFTSSPDGNAQLYINTGTFQPLIERAIKDTDFAVEQRMTMVYFNKKDENLNSTAPSVDIWNGFRKEQYRSCQ
jgi:UDP-2,3-diacylglucosamine pyrophosphatase LpxH